MVQYNSLKNKVELVTEGTSGIGKEIVKYLLLNGVNTVNPSLTLTPLSKKFYTKEEIKETAENNPSKRLGETSDIADTILFLLSDVAEYINGENINVNGGALLL